MSRSPVFGCRRSWLNEGSRGGTVLEPDEPRVESVDTGQLELSARPAGEDGLPSVRAQRQREDRETEQVHQAKPDQAADELEAADRPQRHVRLTLQRPDAGAEI